MWFIRQHGLLKFSRFAFPAKLRIQPWFPSAVCQSLWFPEHSSGGWRATVSAQQRVLQSVFRRVANAVPAFLFPNAIARERSCA
eukprot:3981719-Amphidinium_carterae.1